MNRNSSSSFFKKVIHQEGKMGVQVADELLADFWWSEEEWFCAWLKQL